MTDAMVDHIVNGAITLTVVLAARLWSRSEHMSGQVARDKMSSDVAAIKKAVNGHDNPATEGHG